MGCLGGDRTYNCCVVGKLNDGVGVVPGSAVMIEQGVLEGTDYAPLRGPSGEDQCGGCVVTYPYHLAAPQGVQDPVAEGGIQSQGPQLIDAL